MLIDSSKKERIISCICNAIGKKLDAYSPESDHKPFHDRLLGRDRMALFSFVQSMNTTFGVSIYEPVAKELARGVFVEAKNQYRLTSGVGESAKSEVNSIVGRLASGEEISRESINKTLKGLASQKEVAKGRIPKVDLYLRDAGVVYLFDLKTVKPNMADFENYKRLILEWAAAHYRAEPGVEVESLIAIPYNPYHPEPYKRWTQKGMLEAGTEVKVAEEFWNFVGGCNCYESLLDCFEEAGNILREDIDKKFAEFARSTNS